MKESITVKSGALPELPGFVELLDGYQKFGYHGKASQDDLPALREYRDNLARDIAGNLHDVSILLNLGVDNDGDFHSAGSIGYTLQNAAERIITLSEIGGYVLDSISKLKASAKQGEAS